MDEQISSSFIASSLLYVSEGGQYKCCVYVYVYVYVYVCVRDGKKEEERGEERKWTQRRATNCK